MWKALVSSACRWLNDLTRSLSRERLPSAELLATSASARSYRRLEKVILTDAVSRTLFEGFQSHRQGSNGEEETGWVLLGIREENTATVLATLPAGAGSEAGVAHVRFNSSAQALASRIVRQWDKRLVMVGVVHTHPGSLRHPSDGDFRGDSLWVGQLRGQEGVFGIGTADVEVTDLHTVARQPEPHRQTLADLCFSWYSLRQGDRRYRPLAVCLTLGPDLARPLHPLWETLEFHAEALDRLCRQQARMTFQAVNGEHGPTLLATLPLAEAESELRLLLRNQEVQYLLVREGDVCQVDPKEEGVDRGVYLILAELAARSEPATRTSHFSQQEGSKAWTSDPSMTSSAAS